MSKYELEDIWDDLMCYQALLEDSVALEDQGIPSGYDKAYIKKALKSVTMSLKAIDKAMERVKQ